MGAAEDSNVGDSNGFLAAAGVKDPEKRKLWLFISRVRDGATEGTLREYVSKKGIVDIENVEAKLLPTKIKVKNSNSFMVGVPMSLKDSIYEATFWPKGIHFGRFDFRMGSHFLDRKESSAKTEEKVAVRPDQ